MNRAYSLRAILAGAVAAAALLVAGAAAAQDATGVRLISAHADCRGGNTEVGISIDGQVLTPAAVTTQGCTCGNTIIDYTFTDATELANIDTSGASCGRTIEITQNPAGLVYYGSLGIEIITPGGTERLDVKGDPDDTYACQTGYANVPSFPWVVTVGPDGDGDGILDCDDTDNDNDGIDEMARHAHIVRPQASRRGHAFDLGDHDAAVVAHGYRLFEPSEIRALVFVGQVAALVGGRRA